MLLFQHVFRLFVDPHIEINAGLDSLFFYQLQHMDILYVAAFLRLSQAFELHTDALPKYKGSAN